MNDNNGLGFVDQTLENPESQVQQEPSRDHWADPMELAAHEITGRMNAKAGWAQVDNPEMDIYGDLMAIEDIFVEDAQDNFDECLQRDDIPRNIQNIAYEAQQMTSAVQDYQKAIEEGIQGQTDAREILEVVGYESEVFQPEMVDIEFGQVKGTIPGGKEMAFIPHTMFKNVREIAEEQDTKNSLRFDVYQQGNQAVMEIHDDVGEYPDSVDLQEGFDMAEYDGSGMGLGMTTELTYAADGEIYSQQSEFADYDKKTVIEMPKNSARSTDSYKVEREIKSD